MRLHQGDGGLVPVLGLAADQSYGFVDQDGDLVGLLALGLFIDLDAHIGRDLHAHFRHAAIHLDPALGNPFIGFSARCQAELCHTLV